MAVQQTNRVSARRPDFQKRSWDKRRRRRKRRWWKRALAYLGLLSLSAIIVGMIFLGAMLYQVSQLLPSIEQIESYQPLGATVLYAADGSVLAEIAAEQREPARWEEIPKVLIDATVAKEDKRFWHHKGVDPRGTLRALWVNLAEGKVRQGGSTITQQLARNIFLSRRKTLTRKIQEIMLAAQIERYRTKEEILELYLNQVFYGNQAYGVKAAARVYFDKDLKELTLSEAALLAALPQRPSTYNPFQNPEEARRQRNLVLELMAQEGYITLAQREAAKKEPLHLTSHRKYGLRYRAPYFVTEVLRRLEDQYGREILYRGGLQIQTTLDPAYQEAAERVLQDNIRRFASKGVTQGAVMLMELETGYVRALVGGRDFRESQYNAITQGRRQPGSSFKPIVYATAFEVGNLTPTSILRDSPLSFPGAGGKRWRPHNADGRYRGSVTVERALVWSINVPAVRAMMRVGPKTVAQFARDRFGIESPLDPVLPLALGASAVKPIEMARAFTTFAKGGDRVEPILITQVKDHEDAVIFQQGPQIVPGVLSKQTANWMNDILRKAVERGTGRAAASIPEAHGKTGTTSDYRDAWFIGYTHKYLAVVWVANARYDPKGKRWVYLPMRRVFGGTVPAKIWADLLSEVLKIEAKRAAQRAPKQGKDRSGKVPREQERKAGEPTGGSERLASPDLPNPQPPAETPEPPAPEDQPLLGGRGESGETKPAEVPEPPADKEVRVPICAESGLRANEYCPEVVTKLFPRGREPKRGCRLHLPPEI